MKSKHFQLKFKSLSFPSYIISMIHHSHTFPYTTRKISHNICSKFHKSSKKKMKMLVINPYNRGSNNKPAAPCYGVGLAPAIPHNHFYSNQDFFLPFFSIIWRKYDYWHWISGKRRAVYLGMFWNMQKNASNFKSHE